MDTSPAKRGPAYRAAMRRSPRRATWSLGTAVGAVAVTLLVVAATGLPPAGAQGSSTRRARRPAAGHAALTSCPASRPLSTLPQFAATNAAEIPDDLTVTQNGDVWVTVTTQGHILHFGSNGTLQQDIPDANGPEGIIITPSITVVAEQPPSRIDRLTSDGHLIPFLHLPDRPKLPPLDGLGYDPAHQRLLVPNSPEGTLLVTPLTRAAPRQLARGLGRPVAAAVGPDGAIYVAAESNVGLFRIPAKGGTAKRVGTLSNLDEVVTVGRLLYTAGAGDGTVRAVDPTTGADRVVATGGHQLQGLAPTPDGRLLVIDSVPRTITFVPSCG